MQLIKTACSPTSPEHDIRLEGEIDMAVEQALADTVTLFEACEHRDVCVDASALEFIDSTGLTMLARLARLARDRGGAVRVTAAPHQLERMVEMTKLPVEVDTSPEATCDSAS
jgi:anti-sigma B factor antagonist